MTKKLILMIFSISLCSSLFAQTNYPNNENEQYEDLLTPQYYNTPDSGNFRLELNKFIHFSRMIPFQHPFQPPSGEIPQYTIGRSFGDGLGPGGTGSHHPAIDYYLTNNDSMNLYAACDGYVKIDKTVDRYRHFLSITSEVKDSTEKVIGKMVVIYAHIDLDFDAADNINLEGKFVKKGDLVSKHLYSGTVGGPHLHFEIRYYRATDTGEEDFYGGQVGDKTSPSAGSWTYGFWNPDAGYGFAHPYNHLNQAVTATSENYFRDGIKLFPNPVNNFLTVESNSSAENEIVTIFTIQGCELYRNILTGNNKYLSIDFRDYTKGIYLVNARSIEKNVTFKILKE